MHDDASPYRLYALSNIGSLLALVTYPFLFEPAFDTAVQSGIWSLGFVGFGVLCARCAVLLARAKPQATLAVHRADETDSFERPAWGARARSPTRRGPTSTSAS